MRTGIVTLAVFALLGVAAPRGSTCNLCTEDKIAATYDWAVLKEARGRGHVVVFTAVTGRVTPGDATLERALVRELESVAGVDAGTVRVSLAPPAASFTYDPASRRPSRLLPAINRKLQSRRLALTIIRVGEPRGQH